ncbi:uracil phosphoribosyltransferase-domain-containing protein [Zychaea mexicana]|uniref:uracil phosphoribosyltransferase-domain-containing protein n=1 Tax=Zychaea mexicana TaxID=64656 RepID=UPI0022FEC446|nr:uracil phosphoribosyltransferase-domain-containing protein [Zychaea mexicana]KAI9488608.1 uracil phosphoribosyltransferase-domain-containing protein [Zychaea mexicana]
MTATLHISQHPIVAVKLAQLREAKQNSKAVRELMRELSLLVGYEATADISVSTDNAYSSPYEQFQGAELSQRVALVPILRSGLGLVDGFLTLFPEAPVLHLGLYREKVSLQPVEYYNKLPQTPNADVCYVLDPVIATGNTAVATVNILKEWGVAGENIKFVGVLGSKAGIVQLQEEHPEIHVYVAAVDDTLDDHGYIRPGLGDSGDRLWNTAV